MLQNNWIEIAFADQKNIETKNACNKFRAKIFSHIRAENYPYNL